MCCLETKHNSSPSDRRLENKEKGGEGGWGMNRQKTQRRSTVNKESSVYSAFKDSGIPHHTPALPLRGVTERENSPVKHSVYYSSNSCLKTNML